MIKKNWHKNKMFVSLLSKKKYPIFEILYHLIFNFNFYWWYSSDWWEFLSKSIYSKIFKLNKNLEFRNTQLVLNITSNNKHDWTRVKYLNVLHHNRSTLGTLDMPGHFQQKRYCQLAVTLMFICTQKLNFISDIFLRYCKDVLLLFWELW